MKASSAVVWLGTMVAVLGLIAAGVGLLWVDDGRPFSFTTLRGQSVQIYGQGLYRYDTLFKAPLLRGTDAVTLFVALPLLVLALRRGRGGSLRWRLLQAGLLSYFLYNAASLAFGVAYNSLILVYVAYFSASLFAFVFTVQAIDLRDLAARASPRLPRRGIAAFLFLAGMSVFVWLLEITSGLAEGRPPEHLASYTTEITYVLDLGIIAPVAFLGGILVLRRQPLGYLLAAILLTLLALVGVMVIAQGVAQSLAGVAVSAGELLVYNGTFVVMSLIAVYLLVLLLRNVSDVRKAT